MRMRLCSEDCSNLAQWRATLAEAVHEAPERDEEGKVIAERRVPHGLRLKTIGFVCGEHKKIMQEALPEVDLRFAFCGVIPEGRA